MTLSLVGLCGSLRADSVNRKLMLEAVRRFGEADFREADLRFPLYDGDVETREGVPDEVKAVANRRRGRKRRRR